VSSAANADTVYLEISADESLHIRAFECRFTEERSLKRDELAFVVVTPYTIRKSRTGAILARLLGRVSAELIATQMFAFTEDMAERYAATIRPGKDDQDERHRRMIREYILQECTPESDGYRHRVLLLVFRGENAWREVEDVVGRLYISSHSGETIRDTYGDLVYADDGSVRYFEPAVLTADSKETIGEDLRLWLDFAASQPALLDRVCAYDRPEHVQQTLVLIKPDSWQQRSLRPGSVVDMFSRTGLRIIAMKLCRMSVSQGLAFYGPVRDVLREKLAPGIGERARKLLEQEFGFAISADVEPVLAETVGVPFAQEQFQRILEFMTGRRADRCSPGELNAPGRVKCLGLVYEGENAVAKIRDVLGPTDPMKAPGGTVRREFGSDVMVNTAHASDSAENARREIGILGMDRSNLADVIGAAMDELDY
jgi:nucleoside diphosphate kinase